MAGLKKRFSNVSFAGGVSTKVDPNQIAVGKLSFLQNALFTNPGEIQTRYGYQPFSANRSNSATPISSGQALMPFADELVLCDDTSLYSWDSGANQWTFKAPFQSVNVQTAPVVRNPWGQQSQDENVAPNGIQCDVWEDSQGGSYYYITDTTTGQKVVQPTLIDAQAFKPKVLVQGSLFVIVYVKIVSSTPIIYFSYIPTTLPAQGLTSVAITPSSGNTALNPSYPNYDACVMPNTPGGSLLYLAYPNSVASTSAGLQVTSFGPTLTQVHSSALTSARPSVVSIFPGNTSASSQYSGPVTSHVNEAQNVLHYTEWSFSLVEGENQSVESLNGVGSVTAITGLSNTALGDNGFQLFYSVAPSTWAVNTNYVAGAVVIDSTSGFCYTALNSGTSAGSGNGPTGTVSPITDNTVSWSFNGLASQGTSSVQRVRTAQVDAAFDAPTPVDLIRSVGLIGKAYRVNGVGYIPVGYQSITPEAVGLNGIQNTNFISDAAGNIVARVLSGLAGGLPVTTSIGPNPMSTYGFAVLPESVVSGSTATMPMLQTDLLTSDAAFYFGQFPLPGTNPPLPSVGTYTQTGVTSFAFNYSDPSDSYRREQLGNTLIIGGGMLQMYDSQTVCELGFHLYPDTPNILILDNSASGGLVAATTYYWTYTYEWEDATGATHRSAPGVAQAHTTGSGETSVMLTIPTLRVTSKNGVRIVVYRAIATGTIFYQALSTVVPAATGATNQPIENNPDIDSVQMIDGLSDAALQGNVQLYTTGGVLLNLPTPPASDVTVNYNRLFAVDPTNPLSFYYSQQNITGQAVTMSAWLSFNVDSRGGPIRALRAMDQHLLIFKNTLIMSVDGAPGPDATGNNQSFQAAYIVNVDTGCTNPRSIVLDTTGYTFQGKGDLWYHIDRGLNVTYLGSEAEALMQGNSATSCVMVPYTQQLRMTLDNKTAVVQDYFVNQFGLFTNIDAVDACLWAGNNNQYCFLDPSGVVHGETVGSYSDNGKFIPMSVTSWWVNYTQLNGWCRTWWIYLLSRIISPCNVNIRIAYDYDPSPKQLLSFPVFPGLGMGTQPFGSNPLGNGGPIRQLAIQPSQQLSGAFQITITTSPLSPAQIAQATAASNGTPPNTVGAGIILSGLGFEFGTSPTMRRPNLGDVFGGGG